MTALTMALCKVHNFLIDQNEQLLPIPCCDEAYNSIRGAIDITDDLDAIPEELMNGGEHFDDIDPNTLRQIRQHNNNIVTLPQSELFHSVCEQGLERPDLNRY